MNRKEFKVVSISSNRNAFGLTGYILVARDGEAWQMGLSDHNKLEQGQVVDVPMFNDRPNFATALGAEIPERLDTVNPLPPQALREVWGEQAEPRTG